jgi:putative transposase
MMCRVPAVPGGEVERLAKIVVICD